MAYKISITLEASNGELRDQFLRGLSELLMECPRLEGKIKVSHVVGFVGGGEGLDLAALGVDEDLPATPLERVAGGW